jgi:hypothetical protein
MKQTKTRIEPTIKKTMNILQPFFVVEKTFKYKESWKDSSLAPPSGRRGRARPLVT